MKNPLSISALAIKDHYKAEESHVNSGYARSNDEDFDSIAPDREGTKW